MALLKHGTCKRFIESGKCKYDHPPPKVEEPAAAEEPAGEVLASEKTAAEEPAASHDVAEGLEVLSDPQSARPVAQDGQTPAIHSDDNAAANVKLSAIFPVDAPEYAPEQEQAQADIEAQAAAARRTSPAMELWIGLEVPPQTETPPTSGVQEATGDWAAAGEALLDEPAAEGMGVRAEAGGNPGVETATTTGEEPAIEEPAAEEEPLAAEEDPAAAVDEPATEEELVAAEEEPTMAIERPTAEEGPAIEEPAAPTAEREQAANDGQHVSKEPGVSVEGPLLVTPPRNPKAPTCMSFVRHGICKRFNQTGSCKYDHPPASPIKESLKESLSPRRAKKLLTINKPKDVVSNAKTAADVDGQDAEGAAVEHQQGEAIKSDSSSSSATSAAGRNETNDAPRASTLRRTAQASASLCVTSSHSVPFCRTLSHTASFSASLRLTLCLCASLCVTSDHPVSLCASLPHSASLCRRGWTDF